MHKFIFVIFSLIFKGRGNKDYAKNIKSKKKVSFFIYRKNKKIQFEKASFSSIEISKILEKIMLSQPKFYREIDVTALKKSGYILNKPFYVESAENLNYSYLKNLFIAQIIKPFYLVVFATKKNLIFNYAKKLFKKNIKIFNVGDLSKNLKELLLNVNINTLNFVDAIKSYDYKKPFDITYKNCSLISKQSSYSNYFVNQTYKINNIDFTINSTNIQNNYYLINAIKPQLNNKNIQISIKILIKNNKFDYFYIKKINNVFNIFSIYNNYNLFFYCSKKLNKITLIRIENSNNFLLKIDLNLTENFIFSIGKYKNHLQKVASLNNIDFLPYLTNQQKQKFNMELTSSSKIINFYINSYLPNRSIVEALQSLEICATNNLGKEFKEAENKEFYLNKCSVTEVLNLVKTKKIKSWQAYELLKSKFFSLTQNNIVIKQTELKNYKLKLFLNNQISTIEAKEGEQNCIQIAGLNYINCQTIPTTILNAQQNILITFKAKQKNFKTD